MFELPFLSSKPKSVSEYTNFTKRTGWTRRKSQRLGTPFLYAPRSSRPFAHSPIRRFAYTGLSVVRHLDKIPIRVAEINRLNRASRSGSWDGPLLNRDPCFLK